MTRAITGARATAVFGVLVLLAACGGDDTGSEPAAEPGAAAEETTAAEGTTPADETTEPTTDAGTATGETTSEVTVTTTSTDLGEVLADGEGMVLYMFDPDQQAESTCYDQCEQAWPPLVTDGEAAAGEGVDEMMLGVVPREDGSQQVTYNRWPLYYWAQDSAPGDTTGQGVNDVWWVLDPDGEPVRQPATP